MWGFEVFLHEKVGIVSGRSANRGSHSLGSRGHLGYSLRNSRERKLTLAKYIDVRVAAGCARSASEHMFQRRWQKKRRRAHHLTRWAAGQRDPGPWEAGQWADRL